MGTEMTLYYGYDSARPYSTSFNSNNDLVFGEVGIPWPDVVAYINDYDLDSGSVEMVAKSWAYLLKCASMGENVQIFSVIARSWSIVGNAILWGPSFTVSAVQPPITSLSPQQTAIPQAVTGFYGICREGGGLVQYTHGLMSNKSIFVGNGTPLNPTAPAAIDTYLGAISRVYRLIERQNPVAFSTYNQTGTVAGVVDLKPEARNGVRRKR